jgi:hypothetical protein
MVIPAPFDFNGSLTETGSLKTVRLQAQLFKGEQDAGEWRRNSGNLAGKAGQGTGGNSGKADVLHLDDTP